MSFTLRLLTVWCEQRDKTMHTEFWTLYFIVHIGRQYLVLVDKTHWCSFAIVPLSPANYHKNQQAFRNLNGTSDMIPTSILKRNNSRISPMDDSTKSGSSMASVSFDNITIREYPLTIGDNPYCSTGVPVRWVEGSWLEALFCPSCHSLVLRLEVWT